MASGKLSLYAKIYLIVGLLMATGAGTTVLTLRGLHSTKEAMRDMAEVHFEIRQLASDILSEQQAMIISNRNIILRTGAAEMAKEEAIYEETWKRQDETIDKLNQIASPEQKALLKSFLEVREKWRASTRKMQAFAKANKNDEATALLFGEVAAPRVEMEKLIGDIRKSAVSQAQSQMKESLEASERLTQTSMTVGLVALLAATLIVAFMVRSLKSSIQGVVSALSASAGEIDDASTKVASSAEELSQSVSEQAASLEQTAASVEQISSMVKKSTESAQRSSETSQVAQKKAVEGKNAVERMMTSMGDINNSNNEIMQQTDESNRQMGEIVKVIQEIGNKTKVINDIVFQTKLLSFNASVEAARAGEQGKGFAVVAEEVGNLAQMSGNAAKEISDMLGASLQKVESIAHQNKEKVESLIAQGKSRIDSGVETARQCAQVLEEIVQNVSLVSNLAGEISTANQEQAQGIAEINKAVGQLDQVTQQNSTTGSLTANAAESMSTQVTSLKATVDQLVETIEGHKGDSDRATVAAPQKRTEPAAQAKVIPLPRTPETKEKPAKMKKAAGGEGIPHAQDARFEDV